jgi:hypothetical protein
MGAAYRLHELGWLGFERLCRALLDDAGVRVTTWEHAPIGVRALTSAMDGVHGLGFPELPGPSRIVVERAPRDLDRLALVTRPGESAVWQPHVSLLVLTDVPVPAELAGRVQAKWRDDLDGATVALVDAHGLSAALDRRPLARLRAPWALGVCDQADAVDEVAAGRSTLDVSDAHELARVFVPTRAHAACVQALRRHRFAVLTGPPEMGKTAIARMVALARLSAGWEAHECTRPEKLWEVFDPTRPQVFVADDAFGSTEYRPEAAERWAVELPRILQAMDDTHWLVWTSRPTPLRAGLRRIQREHGTERFPEPGKVLVDASALDVAEKALILFRHARAGSLDQDVAVGVRACGFEIVSHPDYTPERIRRLAARLGRATGDVAEVAEEVLRRPTEGMRASYHALSPEQRALLLAMLDSPAGPVAERDLARAARRHADGPLQQNPTQLVDRLADHFLRVVPPASVAWVHPSWRDLLIDELAGDAAARLAFVSRCGVDGALVALSVGGGAGGERRLPLLKADADWDALTDRLVHLVPELDDRDTARLLHALDAAMASAYDDRQAGPELAALATVLLDALRRIWDAARAPLEVSVLAAWLEAAASLTPQPQAPEIARTWIELQGDETRLEDFGRLALTLQRRLPELYARLAGEHAPALAYERRRVIAEEWLVEPLPFDPDEDAGWRLVGLVLDDLVERSGG